MSNLIWNTESIEEAKLKQRKGAPTDLSAFHERNTDLRGYKVLFEMSADEQEEFENCSGDIEYFVETYCQFLTDKGRQTVDLRTYQKEILNTLGEEEWIESLEDFGPKNRNYILMASRQTGKTTTVAAFFAWYLCFHTDRNLAILANKQTTTTEIVNKVIQVFKALPYFLKPGIEYIGKLGLGLDNGCMLASQATTTSAQIGFTIHVLYIDEFAHIRPNIARSFWRSVYPTLSSSDISQCIVTSTPNGMGNLFYEIWDKSVRGKNSFVNKRVDYWEVEEHDEEWAKKIRDDFGEEEFAQEFELKFDVTANNLLSANDLKWIKRLSRFCPYEYQDLDKSDLDSEIYEKLKFRKDFDINKDFNEKTDRFIISIDIAEGKDIDEVKDNDYNVAHLCQVKLKSLSKLKKLRRDQHQIENLFRIEQVGVYRDNIQDEIALSKVCKAISFDQIGEELIKLVVEMNFNGKSFLNDFKNHDNYFDGMIMHSYHTAPVPGEKPPRKKAGFKVRSDKDYFCKYGKKLINQKTIIPNEEETSLEFSAFGKVKNSWKGIAKHDDLALSQLNISRLYVEEEYKDWLYDFLENLPNSPEKSYAMNILEEPYDENEVSDDMFNALHTEEIKLNEIFDFENQFKGRFK